MLFIDRFAPGRWGRDVLDVAIFAAVLFVAVFVLTGVTAAS